MRRDRQQKRKNSIMFQTHRENQIDWEHARRTAVNPINIRTTTEAPKIMVQKYKML